MAIPGQAKEQELDAIYEQGVFRVLDRAEVPLAEGQRVHLIVQPVQPKGKQSSLKLLSNFYEGLSEEEINEIEKVMFAHRNLRDEPIDMDEQ